MYCIVCLADHTIEVDYTILHLSYGMYISKKYETKPPKNGKRLGHESQDKVRRGEIYVREFHLVSTN